MPAIAQGAARDEAKFYWHLGDLRAIYDFDEDIQKDYKLKGKPLTISEYEKKAWDDFRQNQTVPFGGIPFFLGIGNHETIAPMKTRCEFAKTFQDFLQNPELKNSQPSVPKNAPPQKAGPSGDKSTQSTTADGCPEACDDVNPTPYFHWVKDGIDFIYLDNATKCQFTQKQLDWFDTLMKNDAALASVRTVVVGMHKALPYSISQSHSMNESPRGEESGRQVYQDLLKLQNEAHKKVYVLASHSHYYMEDIFNTQYWRSNGGVLAGWIVGTAGAHRYPLPEPNSARVAKTNVYGYLLGTVNSNGQAPGAIQFEFREIKEQNVPQAIVHGFTQEFVHWCFVNNTDAKPAASAAQP
ncbi:MAG TPA: hypothetical protein VEF05_10425 [Terriglobales bacterium]|nr:hypothetical protein [Terriglobales bacterium]